MVKWSINHIRFDLPPGVRTLRPAMGHAEPLAFIYGGTAVPDYAIEPLLFVVIDPYFVNIPVPNNSYQFISDESLV